MNPGITQSCWLHLIQAVFFEVTTMIYSFQEQLHKGKEGEFVVSEYFSPQYEIVEATPAQFPSF
jgi:hypothetical protein